MVLTQGLSRELAVGMSAGCSHQKAELGLEALLPGRPTPTASAWSPEGLTTCLSARLLECPHIMVAGFPRVMILKRVRREGSHPGLGSDTCHFCLVLFVRSKLGGPAHTQELPFKIHLFEAGSWLLHSGFSLVAESSGIWAQQLRCMGLSCPTACGNLPRPGLKLRFPALAGGL